VHPGYGSWGDRKISRININPPREARALDSTNFGCCRKIGRVCCISPFVAAPAPILSFAHVSPSHRLAMASSRFPPCGSFLLIPPDPHPLPPCGDIYAPLPAAPSLFAPTFPLTTSASLPLCPLFEAVVENLPTMRGRGGRRSHTHDRHDALELRRLFLQSSSVSSHACDKPDSPLQFRLPEYHPFSGSAHLRSLSPSAHLPPSYYLLCFPPPPS